VGSGSEVKFLPDRSALGVYNYAKIGERERVGFIDLGEAKIGERERVGV
jgi:hypothetical protein